MHCSKVSALCLPPFAITGKQWPAHMTFLPPAVHFTWDLALSTERFQYAEFNYPTGFVGG